MKSFKRIFGYMRPYWLSYGLGMFMYSAQGFFFGIVFATFMAGVMAAILASDAQIMWDAILVMGISVLAIMVAIAGGVYIYVVASIKATKDMKKDLLRSFVNTGLENSQASHTGESVAAINTEADTASEIFDNPMREFLNCIISIVGFGIFIFWTNWMIGVGTFLIGGLAFLAQNRFTKPLSRIGKEQLEANAAAVSSVSNIFSGGLTTRAYNMQNRALMHFDNESGKLRLLDFKRAAISAFQGVFTTVQGWLTLGLTFGFGGFLVIQGSLDLSDLMFLVSLVTGTVFAFGAIGRTYANLQPPIVACGKVAARLDASNEQSARNDEIARKNGGQLPNLNNYKITINNFNFTYKMAENEALQGISVEIPENKMVAFVGESGSGKSTLLRAVIGMYERDEMPLYIGGVGYNDVTTKNWRKNFAYVDQSCKLFDMSIAENIAMGAGGNASQEEIEKAAKRAFAHDFIMEIEGGYDAQSGEKGGGLSGGQKQRVAIARALVKGAPILVFDEATSALDKESEAHIMDTIHSLRNDHTILITTHNLATIQTADIIVVLQEGRVAETGTHDELIAAGGVYKKLLDQNT